MKIVSSGVQMASSHASAQHHEIEESLRFWAGERRPDFEGRGRPAVLQPVETVQISAAGRAALDGRKHIELTDVQAAWKRYAPVTKQAIGFTA